MYIVAIAWIYVVFMMSVTEHTVVAGIMTFLLYGVLPLSIILYLMGTPQRKRNRVKAEKILRDQKEADAAAAASSAEPMSTGEALPPSPASTDKPLSH